MSSLPAEHAFALPRIVVTILATYMFEPALLTTAALALAEMTAI